MAKKIVTSPFFLFPLFACIVFWPFTFQLFSLKNDALTYYYPIRTLISDALNNGELPLWTPFINMGYPLHADMQSGAWNPVIWAFALLTKYSLASFHYELLFYISFAGIGFYYLCRELECSKTVAFMMAAAYQLSGFMIDSVQFFTCISSACYIPFVFLFFRRMMKQHSVKNAMALGFFLFLLFTGGYPSLFIITSYSLAAYFLFYFFGSETKILFLKKRALPLLAASVSFLILSMPAIISFILHLPEIERGKSQALSVVLENSMNPSCMLSFISPFSVTANDKWLDSSILMRNDYIGIIPLIFLIYLFTQKNARKNREIIFFLGCSLVMFGLAWGRFFYLRQLAYYTLPLMNSFRHPALFRLFSILFLLLIAGRGLEYWRSHTDNAGKKVTLAIAAAILLIGAISVGTLRPVHFTRGFNSVSLKDLLFQLNFSGRYLVQFSFPAFVTLLAYYLISKRKDLRLMFMVMFADMFFAAQLNMPITVYGAKSFSVIEETINRNPVKFPLPGNQSIEENSRNSFDPEFVAGSKLPFTKKFGRNDYFITPGNLTRQDEFYESPVKDVIFKNEILYFPDTLINENQLIFPDRKRIAFMDGQRSRLNSYGPDSSRRIHISNFSANTITAETHSASGGTLVYMQNRYHGWHAFVDNKETMIFPVNTSFMAINVPPGDHQVNFIYKPGLIIKCWYVSVSAFILMLIYFVFFSRQRSMKHRMENV